MAALIAVALLFAPLQVARAAPAADMLMGENCPEKQSCCDLDKADCVKAEACFAKCGSAPGLAMLGAARRLAVAEGVAASVAGLSLMSRAIQPMRRPPRA